MTARFSKKELLVTLASSFDGVVEEKSYSKVSLRKNGMNNVGNSKYR